MSNCPYAVTHEVENMTHVAKGPYHGPAPITQVEIHPIGRVKYCYAI